MWSKLSNSHKTDDVAHWIMVGDLIDEDTVGAGYEVFNKRLKDVFDHYGGVLGASRLFNFCASGRFLLCDPLSSPSICAEFRKTRSSRKK
jgi:hypothetical protein